MFDILAYSGFYNISQKRGFRHNFLTKKSIAVRIVRTITGK